MNHIDLTNRFRLYAFHDYWSMRAAKASVTQEILAKEFKEVKEIEAKHYVQRHGDYAYRNYLRMDKA